MVEMGKESKYLGLVWIELFQYYVTMDGDDRTIYMNIKNTFLASELSFVSHN